MIVNPCIYWVVSVFVKTSDLFWGLCQLVKMIYIFCPFVLKLGFFVDVCKKRDFNFPSWSSLCLLFFAY